MNKISGVKVARVMQALPGMIRSLASERDEALEKCASLEARLAEFEHQGRVEKVAHVAQQRNVVSLGRTVEEKVASINEAIEGGEDLDTLERAVQLQGPDGSLGDLEDQTNVGGGSSSPSGSALESFILS